MLLLYIVRKIKVQKKMKIKAMRFYITERESLFVLSDPIEDVRLAASVILHFGMKIIMNY